MIQQVEGPQTWNVTHQPGSLSHSGTTKKLGHEAHLGEANRLGHRGRRVGHPGRRVGRRVHQNRLGHRARSGIRNKLGHQGRQACQHVLRAEKGKDIRNHGKSRNQLAHLDVIHLSRRPFEDTW